MEQNYDKKKVTVKKKWIFTGVAVVLICVVLLIIAMSYAKKMKYYSSHYFPNTFVNGMDCSELDAEAVSVLLNLQAQEYSLQIVGKDRDGKTVTVGEILGKDIELALTDSLQAANDILQEQDEKHWYKIYQNQQYTYDIVQGVTFNEALLRSQLEKLSAFQKENMIAPTDAYIGEYAEGTNTYEIIPETEGNTVDMDALLMVITAGIYGNAQTIDLTEHDCYLHPQITAEDSDLRADLAKLNRWLKTDITYDWNGFSVKIDKNIIKDWILWQEKEPELSEEAVAEFVKENAAQYDTYGKTRKFVTTLGVELSLPSGAFGWKTDQEEETRELINLIKRGAVTQREPVYSSKAPQKGMNDIGNSYVEADLTNQHLYLYHDGNLVLESDFVSGDMNKAGCITPQGVFGLTYKTTNAVLRGANYETPVNYWMPFHGNFGMHDATWRTEFGGDFYITGEGSHGCINLPLEKAAEIYKFVYTSHPIICYYY